jgi:hypothetical protein
VLRTDSGLESIAVPPPDVAVRLLLLSVIISDLSFGFQVVIGAVGTVGIVGGGVGGTVGVGGRMIVGTVGVGTVGTVGGIVGTVGIVGVGIVGVGTVGVGVGVVDGDGCTADNLYCG